MSKVSDVLPPARVLAEIYLADDTLTVESLAARYGISYNAIRPTLNRGLAIFGTTAAEVRHGRRQMIKDCRPRAATELPRCCRCEMLLPQEAEEGLCELCQPGAVDYVTFIASTYYEGL